MCNKCNQNHSHHSHHNCGCTEVEEVTYICNECQPEPDCDCAVKDLSTDCIIYDGDDLPCTEIKKNTILTDLIQQLDTFICKLKDDIANLFVLVNIGGGKKIYAGDNLLGNKKLRTINKSGDLITVTEATEEIVIGLDEDELENTITSLLPNYNAENVGTGADVFKEEVANTFRFRTLKSSDSSVEITESANEIDLTVEPTEVEAGTNVTVTGTGTPADPYVISSTATGPTINFEDGITTTLEGDGTIADPFRIEVKNLQKTITANYTISNADNNFDIFVDCSAGDILITVPQGLMANIQVCFFQKGSNEVTFQSSGLAVLNSPSGTKIRGNNWWAYLTQFGLSDQYQLAGALIL